MAKAKSKTTDLYVCYVSGGLVPVCPVGVFLHESAATEFIKRCTEENTFSSFRYLQWVSLSVDNRIISDILFYLFLAVFPALAFLVFLFSLFMQVIR